MKYTVLGLLAMAATGCATTVSRTESAAGDVVPAVSLIRTSPSGSDLAMAYSGVGVSLESRLATLDEYIGWVEARLPSSGIPVADAPLTSVETFLAPDAFSDVTDEIWERMDSFYDGWDLKRLRMIPPPGESATEEFYYNNGKLVFVFYDPDGANKSDPHAETGESFYFGEEGLIAWVLPDGTRVDPSHADFKHWSKHLQREGERFARGAKPPR